VMIGRSARRWKGPGRPSLDRSDRVELDPLEMLARLCQHIPPPRFHTTRLSSTPILHAKGSVGFRAARSRPP